MYIVDSDDEPIETIPERVFATSESVRKNKEKKKKKKIETNVFYFSFYFSF